MKGPQMRECRKSMKLGQIECGRLIGYTGSAKTVKDTVYKYESGKRDIPPMVARLMWLLSELYKAGIAPEFPNWPHYLEKQNAKIYSSGVDGRGTVSPNCGAAGPEPENA